jgi:pimeloyl-ACP methyl ester carboxylesterase
MRNTDRFLTTHTGSLPRPDGLMKMMFAAQDEVPVEPVALAEAVGTLLIADSDQGSAAITRSTTLSATKQSTPESQAFEVDVSGGVLAVESAGAGPALVLLHGWALDRRVWAPQKPLADRFRLIALDRRGFGDSTAPPDLAAEVGDLLALREAIGLGPLILVGMSQGARTALQFALRHPPHLGPHHLAPPRHDHRRPAVQLGRQRPDG